jgi:hypothetical protein
MPLPVLAILVVGGIAAIAVLTWAFGMAAPRRFADPAEARDAWLREYPALPPQDIVLCDSRTAALVETVRGPGLVWAMGADSAARLFVAARAERRRNGLRVHLPDYDAPRIDLSLTEDEARLWAARISPGSAVTPTQEGAPAP